jgi:D-glycero-D-manno-heptose 1,7-bisphosphate phosphatase
VKRAVFLDRDGVLNPPELRDGRLRAPVTLAAFRPFPAAADAVRRLHDAGFVCLVVTNQPEVASGALSPVVLDAMHERLRRETAVDAVYVCPHVDADGCECRKPRPGLLRQAAADWRVDLAASWLVGDRWRDIAAGAAVGCTTLLVEGSSDPAGEPDFRAATLTEAVGIILSAREARR